MCGGDSDNGTGVSPVLLFSPVSIITPELHTNFQLHVALTRRQLATGWKVLGSNPGENKIFRPRPDRSWGQPGLLYNGYRVITGGKAAEAWL
jgi:hypothetical protein